MDHITSTGEWGSRKFDRKDFGETSRGHNQFVAVPTVGTTKTMSVPMQYKSGIISAFMEDKFKKLEEARVQNQDKTTIPKIQKVC